ncbi:MAG: TRAP transporter substrate-binding protein [Betaproteobacteria bacterium]|nr:TRAP transporter substrate-binding protein [Betaproteobacteria bacterium]
MKLQTTLEFTAALIAAGIVALFPLPAAAQTELTMSLWIPSVAPFVQQAMLPWARQVEQATGNRVVVRNTAKAVASAPGHLDAVRDGLADVTFMVHGYTPGRFVLTKLAEMPFLGDNAVATSVAYNRIHNALLARADEHRGVKALAVFTHGPGAMYSTARPMTKLEDLAGMKMRTGGGIVNDLGNALGVAGLMKPPSDVYEMMSSGVADGTFFARESILTFKIAPLVKHALFVPGGLFNTSFALIMNEERFNKLSAADQAAIMSVSGENFARLAGASFEESDAKGVALLRQANATLTTASPAFTEQLRKATQPVFDAWVNLAAAKGIDGREAAAALRAEAAKVPLR